MRIAKINVPEGCKEIFVDIEEGGKLIVSYGSSINSKEFFLPRNRSCGRSAWCGRFCDFMEQRCEGKGCCGEYRKKCLRWAFWWLYLIFKLPLRLCHQVPKLRTISKNKRKVCRRRRTLRKSLIGYSVNTSGFVI